MTKSLLFVVFLILSCFSALAENGSDCFAARVVGITDGDTIKVLKNGIEIKLRLNGIDCPEKGQDFGQQAKEFTSQQCFEKDVSVQPFNKDRYGRTIAEVTLPNGSSLNKLLVESGLAWWYRKYAPNNTDLQKLESTAREIKIGLWKQPNPIAPWEFRKHPTWRDSASRQSQHNQEHYRVMPSQDAKSIRD